MSRPAIVAATIPGFSRDGGLARIWCVGFSGKRRAGEILFFLLMPAGSAEYIDFELWHF
jgi:hypothetical protein